MFNLDYETVEHLAIDQDKPVRVIDHLSHFQDMMVQKYDEQLREKLQSCMTTYCKNPAQFCKLTGYDIILLSKTLSGDPKRRLKTIIVERLCTKVIHTSVHEFLFGETPTIVLPKNLSFLCEKLLQTNKQQRLDVQTAIMDYKQMILSKELAWQDTELFNDRYAALHEDRWQDKNRQLLEMPDIIHAHHEKMQTEGRNLSWEEEKERVLPLTTKRLGVFGGTNYYLGFLRMSPLLLYGDMFHAIRSGVPIDYLVTTNYLSFANVFYSLECGGVWHSMYPPDGACHPVEDLLTLNILEHITTLPVKLQTPIIAKAISMLGLTAEI